jgi:hypothetical protein
MYAQCVWFFFVTYFLYIAYVVDATTTYQSPSDYCAQWTSQSTCFAHRIQSNFTADVYTSPDFDDDSSNWCVYTHGNFIGSSTSANSQSYLTINPSQIVPHTGYLRRLLVNIYSQAKDQFPFITLIELTPTSTAGSYTCMSPFNSITKFLGNGADRVTSAEVNFDPLEFKVNAGNVIAFFSNFHMYTMDTSTTTSYHISSWSQSGTLTFISSGNHEAAISFEMWKTDAGCVATKTFPGTTCYWNIQGICAPGYPSSCAGYNLDASNCNSTSVLTNCTYSGNKCIDKCASLSALNCVNALGCIWNNTLCVTGGPIWTGTCQIQTTQSACTALAYTNGCYWDAFLNECFTDKTQSYKIVSCSYWNSNTFLGATSAQAYAIQACVSHNCSWNAASAQCVSTLKASSSTGTLGFVGTNITIQDERVEAGPNGPILYLTVKSAFRFNAYYPAFESLFIGMYSFITSTTSYPSSLPANACSSSDFNRKPAPVPSASADMATIQSYMMASCNSAGSLRIGNTSTLSLEVLSLYGDTPLPGSYITRCTASSDQQFILYSVRIDMSQLQTNCPSQASTALGVSQTTSSTVWTFRGSWVSNTYVGTDMNGNPQYTVSTAPLYYQMEQLNTNQLLLISGNSLLSLNIPATITLVSANIVMSTPAATQWVMRTYYQLQYPFYLDPTSTRIGPPTTAYVRPIANCYGDSVTAFSPMSLQCQNNVCSYWVVVESASRTCAIPQTCFSMCDSSVRNVSYDGVHGIVATARTCPSGTFYSDQYCVQLNDNNQMHDITYKTTLAPVLDTATLSVPAIPLKMSIGTRSSRPFVIWTNGTVTGNATALQSSEQLVLVGEFGDPAYASTYALMLTDISITPYGGSAIPMSTLLPLFALYPRTISSALTCAATICDTVSNEYCSTVQTRCDGIGIQITDLMALSPALSYTLNVTLRSTLITANGPILGAFEFGSETPMVEHRLSMAFFVKAPSSSQYISTVQWRREETEESFMYVWMTIVIILYICFLSILLRGNHGGILPPSTPCRTFTAKPVSYVHSTGNSSSGNSQIYGESYNPSYYAKRIH